MSRIAIATIGTQGDVQPFLALALALTRRGHTVVLGAPSDFEGFVTGHGIEFANLGTSIQSLLATPAFDKAMRGFGVLTQGGTLFRQMQAILHDATLAGWRMAQGADAMVINLNTSFGLDIAEALGIPAFMGAPQPLHPTAAFPMVAWPGKAALPRSFNRLSHALLHAPQVFYNLHRNRLRREVMELGPRRSGRFLRYTDGSPLPTLYCYSELVCPRPADWPDTAIVTGYWRLADRSEWRPPPDFRAFLDAGEPPVYIGFGSMPFGAERNTRLIVETMRLWGGRAVVARGWGGLQPADLPANVFAIDKAPHDRLFPLMKAVVHHGGAGTTAAGLFAGRPGFVVPQTVDQPFWGRRVHALGCGPAPVPIGRITPDRLAQAIAELVSTPAYAHAAETLAVRLSAEDGPARAIAEIEAALARSADPAQELRRASSRL